LIWIADPVGNRLNVAYDAEDRLATVADPATNRALSFHYNTAGMIEWIQGPTAMGVADGLWVTYQYAGGNLTSVAYADGSGYTYAFEDAVDSHNLTAKRNQLGHLLNEWGYDAADRCTSRFSRDGKGVSLIAYASSTRVDVTDAYGVVRSYTVGATGERRRSCNSMESPMPLQPDNAVRWQYNSANDPHRSGIRGTAAVPGGGSVAPHPRYRDFNSRGRPRTMVMWATAPMSAPSPSPTILSSANR